MTHYTATTESGHSIIIHGARELARYRRSIEQGESESIYSVETTALRDQNHRHLRDLGQCYGPCTLSEREARSHQDSRRPECKRGQHTVINTPGRCAYCGERL